MSADSVLGPPPPAAEGIVNKLSPYSAPETLRRLEKAVQAKGLTVFAQIDHSGEAERVGLTLRPTHVLIFGSPRAGTPLMVASPLLALDLPLKVLVWQDGEGRVWMSYNSTAYLANRYAIPSELTKNIAGVDALVDEALQR
jgi:uncharacterized protein (DUF302 family)